MTCTFCGSRNVAGETRCRRCGRKSDDTLRSAPDLQTMGALAAAPWPYAENAPAASTVPPVARPMSAAPVQRNLFVDSSSKVVPIEGYVPARANSDPARAKPQSKPRRAISRRVETQGELDFLPSAPTNPRKLGTTVEAVIFCDAPVATRLHRAIAASVDWSVVLLGYGLCLLAYRLTGGGFPSLRAGQLVVAGALPVLAFAYGLLWALLNTETYGMRWARLRLLNVDGYPPDPGQRMVRFAGSCLSVLTCGLGLVWALGDEESLTWQDHMSRTFPTPRGLEDQVFRRT